MGGGGDGWVLMGGIFLVFKEFFLEGVWPPPHEISAYTPLGRDLWTTGQFLPSVPQFLTVQTANIGGGRPPPGSAAPGHASP